MNNYYELKIKINPEMSEIISDILFSVFDCEGVVMVEETYKDLEMINSTEGTLKAFICGTEKPDFDLILKEQKAILKSRGLTDEELGSWEFTVEEKENQDWSKKWKEKWDVTHVSEHIAVVPTWIEYSAKPDEIIINLDPGCAFGTGTHQTTQLCMKALEKYFKSGQSMADIGMGTGILSILAKKLGASEVYGCDNDETVIAVARDNAKLNGEICTFEFGTADKITEKYDFVCANILHNVLYEIMGDLKNIMKDNALMSLSGILKEKALIVQEAIERENLKIIDEIQQDQWTSFVVKKG